MGNWRGCSSTERGKVLSAGLAQHWPPKGKGHTSLCTWGLDAILPHFQLAQALLKAPSRLQRAHRCLTSAPELSSPILLPTRSLGREVSA